MRAIIYCRVSTKKQVSKGDGLGSQEQRCREYAARAGYKVIAVFKEAGESGGLFERPAMMRVLKCLEENNSQDENDKIVVIFDDLKRFARDTVIHFKLKEEIYGRNGTVESPNFKFEDTPDGKFVETVMAAAAELERNQNKKQVIQKTKARLERGYWTFRPSLGLKFIKNRVHGKLLVPNEPYASIYKEAIENYRDGILPTIEEVFKFVNLKYKDHGLNNQMSQSNAKRMLTDVLYAGYIEYPNWGLERRKAQHEGIISIETYKAVQDRLRGVEKPWKRKDYNVDFPLRPLVLCAFCKAPMTGSWSTGRHGGKYAHYYCRNPKCEYVWKTIKKQELENAFEVYLETIKPKSWLCDLAKAVLLEQWHYKKENEISKHQSTTKALEEVKIKIKSYIERVGKTNDEDLIAEYENEIKDLRQQRNDLLSQSQPTNEYTFEKLGTATEKVFATLKEPVSMWKSDNYNDRRTILLMYFDDKLQYDRNFGFGTLNSDYPINLIGKIAESKNLNVDD